MHFTAATILAFASSAVLASPFQRRQESVTGSAAVSSEGATTSTAVSAVTGTETTGSAIESATSALGSAVSGAATATGSSAPAATATSEANATSPEVLAYPCPIGYLLSYSQVNQTLPIPVTEAVAAAGEWADSPLFPEVSEAMGGTEPGATHTINVLGVSIPEVLVNATANETSGFAQWVWNNTAPVSVPAQGIEISNYSTVFKAYDPDFTTTGEIGNTTLVQIFTNACANDQNATITLLETLANFELSQLAAALGNETSPAAGGDVPATTTAATAEVTATETAEETAVQTSSAVETVSETVPAETATATETAATETVQSTAATSTAVTTAETVTATTTA